ncbi:GGDEF domain-containing protein [Rhizobiaceae bacterium n13]|uniref:diguanylate cyclase n=1 Tax=Ferirhizobium litorale TaxID=2927786 RepID=A0AAE3U359_9HYPH|nr:GGDEF domain-containing protein [Fererhizobium litorale]MDI7863857.1 GGDEF domain-containing protein [Fererhizobium litorale]MDI7924311.1 GGDEF domain-containing protein [Fererhizobium litorale]
MSSAVAPKAPIPDIASHITYAMRTMGVAPIPRNYELFYEAYIGSNPALTKKLASYGNSISQDELDAVAAQFFGNRQLQVVDNAHIRIVSELEAIVRLLKQEQNSLESYNRLLGETCNRITTKSNASSDILQNAIAILAKATGDTMAHGERTVESVSQKSREMEQVRQELDEYKRIANTDSLTRLANRRAFDDRLAAVYDGPLNRHLSALILADIDNFKAINDNYGHPVGDKILATVATIIRTTVPHDVFVARTGGEEFAILVDGCSEDEALQIAERVRTTLASTPFRNSKTGIDYGPITISLGVCMGAEAEDPGDLYGKCDAALYCAKHAGRNCSVAYENGMKKEFSKSWLIYKK